MGVRQGLRLFGRVLGWLGLGLVGLVLVVLVLAWIGIHVPLSRIAPVIEPVVEQTLDAELSFAEGSYFELSLRPGLSIDQLRIDGPDIDLQVSHFSGNVRLLPLVRKRLSIGRIAVAGGRLDYTRRIGAKDEQPSAHSRDRGRKSTLRSITIDEVEFDDVSAVITDADSGDQWRFAITDLGLELPEPGELQAELEGSYQDTPFTAKLESRRGKEGTLLLERLIVTGPASRLFVSSRLNTAPLQGEARFELELTSEDEFRKWLGDRAAPLAPVRFEANALFVDNKGRIEIERFLLGPAQFDGDAALDLSGNRPSARLALHSEGFDAGPLLLESAPPLEAAEERRDAVDTSETKQQAGKRETKNRTDPPLADLVTPYLEAMEIDLGIKIDRIDGLTVEVESLSIETRLTEGRLNLPVSVVLAEVPFEGDVGILIEGPEVVLDSQLEASPSDIGGLAKAFMNADNVHGDHGGLNISLGARGTTVRELLADFALRGSLRDSALYYGDRPVGFELANMDFSAGMLETGKASARGVLLGQPFTATLETVPIAQVLRGEGSRMRLEVEARDTRILLDGALDSGAAGLAFALQGRDREVIRDWLGIELSRSVPVALAGRVNHEAERLHFVIDPLRLGRSSVSLDAYTSGPNDDYKLRATVRGKNIDLQEWVELMAETDDQKAVDATRGGGVRLDIPILPSDYRILDSDFDLGVDDLSYDALRFDSIRLVGRSRDGQIQRGDLSVESPYGAFDGELTIDLASSRPEISLQADAQPMRLGSLLTDLGVFESALMEADSASIRFAIAGQTANEIFRSIDAEFLLKNGVWDMLPDVGLIARFDEARFVAHGDEPIRVNIAGDIDGQPMRLDIDMTAISRVAEDHAATLNLAAALGDLRFETALAGALPLGAEASTISVLVESPGLDELNELLGLDLPPWGPIHVSGELTHRTGHYSMPNARVAVSNSELLGELSLDVRDRPQLVARFTAPLVQLDDFRSPGWRARRGPETPARTEPEAAAESDGERESVLSQKAFESLDAAFSLEVVEVRSGADRLGSGRIDAQLNDGVFDLIRLGLELPGGEMEARGRMQWRDSERLNAHVELDVDQLDYGVLARRKNPESTMKGMFSLFARLDADYVASRGLMSGASGAVVFGVWPEDFKSGIFDLWAIGLANALIPKLDKGEASTVNCIVGGFNLEDGLLEERILFADTSRIQASGDIDANFSTRELDARIVPKAKRAQIFSFAAPVTVDGEFDDYSIGIRRRDLLASVFRFIASPVVAPIRWISEDPIPRDGVAACEQAWRTNIGASAASADGAVTESD